MKTASSLYLLTMPKHILRICIFLSILALVGGTVLDIAKTTGDREFEPSGNELFHNAGQQRNKKKLKHTGLKLENSVLKSKVEALGEILKKHVNSLRMTENKQVELVFLVDSSASVGAENFESELKFVQKLLADFTVSENTTRVSVVVYSSPNNVVRHIDHISSPSPNKHKCGLLHYELPNIKYTGGGTYTRGALLEAQVCIEFYFIIIVLYNQK
ncbi:Sushi [Blattella germanica]|nr:Sushi [Blattella germanica]